MGRAATLNTKELALRGTVFFSDMAAGRTLARRVARVNLLHHHAGERRLVVEKSLELVERPISMSRALRLTNRYPDANTRQVCNGQSALGVFSLLHDMLCY